MPINPEAVGATSEPTRTSWTSKDALLYAVGVGAGQSPLDELQYTTENSADIDQKVLPTMAVVLGFGGGFDKIGDFNMAMLVHGEQSIELHREIPVEGEIETVGERVDDDLGVAGRRLDQAELGPVDRLAHEFGINGHIGMLQEGVTGRFEGLRRGNHVHETAL
ncbi:MAG: hypothetical protein OSA99_05450 [Acidimicrobiales bacterium]|nr:hypothetical protein [Acidimicrobiales bacterium]